MNCALMSLSLLGLYVFESCFFSYPARHCVIETPQLEGGALLEDESGQEDQLVHTLHREGEFCDDHGFVVNVLIHEQADA